VENYDTLFSAMEGVEYVYHCAAMVDLGKNSQRMIDVNVGGTENIVRAALNRKVKKLCFVSSIAALSNGNENKPTDENTPFHENERTTLYGESKRLGEKVVHEAILKGLNAVTVNPGVIIGYSKNMTGSGELFKRVKKGLPFYTNGITGYVNVQDVVKAMIVLMKSEVKNERFVLVGENKTHKDVLRNIADGYGKYRPFIGMGKSLISISYALEMLGKLVGFTPLIDSSSARTSISKKRYSSEKFKKTFPDFQFSSIENTIHKICQFDK
jgi:nucleoside-diphosphate-sugar epimerase